MTTTRARVLLLCLTAVSIAACSASDTTSPTQQLKAASARPDDIIPDSVPDASCRSGYAMGNGRCTG